MYSKVQIFSKYLLRMIFITQMCKIKIIRILCKGHCYLHPNFTINPLTPDDNYSGRTAPLTSKRCILYIYSTNIGTEYFKYGIYSPFFSCSKCSLFHNSNVFGSCIIHILCTGCAKIKKKIRRQKVKIFSTYIC